MKNFKLTIRMLIGIMLMAITFAACSQMDDDVVADTTSETQVYHLTLDAQLDDYDGTRAVTQEWQEGDTLYINFVGSTGSAVKTIATYNVGSKDWTFTLQGSLADGSYDMNIKYVRGAKKFNADGNMSFDYTACAYECTATAMKEGNRLLASAVLKPLTGRVRLVSQQGTKYYVLGMTHYDGITSSHEWSVADIDRYSFTYDGTTNPFYYFSFEDSLRTITIQCGGYIFTRSFSANVLAKGMSGYINVPTYSSHNGWEMFEPKYVDLGLPSGTLWATCNVGATKAEGYGKYFAWGETKTKASYDWATYKWCNGSSTTINKYCTSSSYGTVDNKTTLTTDNDVARVNWGDAWRMPTYEELQELNNNTYCTWTWKTLNGVNGYEVKSVTNGNTIFLPAAGSSNATTLNKVGSSGYYWSSLLYSSNNNYAFCLNFGSASHILGSNYVNRSEGLSIRPVHTTKSTTNSVGIFIDEFNDTMNDWNV